MPWISIDRILESQETQEPQGSWPCRYCPKVYEGRGQLSLHTEVVHGTVTQTTRGRFLSIDAEPKEA